MILAIAYVKFESLELQTCPQRQSSTMGRAAIRVADFHFVSPAEVIACSNIDDLPQQQVSTEGDMTPEALIPLRQTAQCDMEAQGRSLQTLANAHLHVEGDALKFVIVSLHLSTEVSGDCRETPVALLEL